MQYHMICVSSTCVRNVSIPFNVSLRHSKRLSRTLDPRQLSFCQCMNSLPITTLSSLPNSQQSKISLSQITLCPLPPYHLPLPDNESMIQGSHLQKIFLFCSGKLFPI
ncbi:hypothetical protein CEXT_186091 [Caerostris extrusa]|uniref:Uncharacterized protein n=1 Tax=Caerostris extrusa TaxID=172846 RepID=A0AAV4TSH4_CAEEX|nr:hypothetical protein CEXT_186091 [Caerostris extrusa]